METVENVSYTKTFLIAFLALIFNYNIFNLFFKSPK